MWITPLNLHLNWKRKITQHGREFSWKKNWTKIWGLWDLICCCLCFYFVSPQSCLLLWKASGGLAWLLCSSDTCQLGYESLHKSSRNRLKLLRLIQDRLITFMNLRVDRRKTKTNCQREIFELTTFWQWNSSSTNWPLKTLIGDLLLFRFQDGCSKGFWSVISSV